MGKELSSSWMPAGEASKEKAKSQRRVSRVIRELLECTDLSLGYGEPFAALVEREVSL
jgi:hypothetical protein